MSNFYFWWQWRHMSDLSSQITGISTVCWNAFPVNNTENIKVPQYLNIYWSNLLMVTTFLQTGDRGFPQSWTAEIILGDILSRHKWKIIYQDFVMLGNIHIKFNYFKTARRTKIQQSRRCTNVSCLKVSRQTSSVLTLHLIVWKSSLFITVTS